MRSPGLDIKGFNRMPYAHAHKTLAEPAVLPHAVLDVTVDDEILFFPVKPWQDTWWLCWRLNKLNNEKPLRISEALPRNKRSDTFCHYAFHRKLKDLES
jgi:hypothetical protein